MTLHCGRNPPQPGRSPLEKTYRKLDAQHWLDKQVSDQVTGMWTDPALSAVTFGAMAEHWISTKTAKAPRLSPAIAVSLT